MTEEEMTLGGPGLDGYAYRAEVYCPECAAEIVRKVCRDFGGDVPSPDCNDSEVCPQPIFFGEADTAQHCAGCEEYLYGDDPED